MGVKRWSKIENRMIYNGCHDNEETAAHASDTLARILMKNGEEGHKLNFPDDHNEVYSKGKKSTFQYFGVGYSKNKSKWCSFRWSRSKNKALFNGYYENEDTAAHASDTLARQLIKKGEQGHKLNFPDDETEIYPEKKNSKYFGVSYNKNNLMWYSCRHSRSKKTTVYNGYYDNEEAAARASDTLARELMKNGERNHKLNFPGYIINHQMYIKNATSQQKKRKNHNLEYSQNK